MPGGGTALRVSLVAALDRNRAIGRGNALPWHLPDDFRRFRALTMGKPILMGRRTADSLGRALSGRRNLVLTRGGRVPFAGMEAVASVDAALRAAEEDGAGELCVIGGAQVYALTRSEEHTSELQSLMRISYAVFCLKKKKHKNTTINMNM